MSVFLLDVNVMLSLAWPAHEFHDRARRWFRQNASKGWATCPFTEAAFVRILGNPRFSPSSVSPRQTLLALEAHLSEPAHLFWPDDIPVAECVAPLRQRLRGHRQITDAYLLGLAIRKRGTLATFDQGLMSLLAGDDPKRAHIAVIP